MTYIIKRLFSRIKYHNGFTTQHLLYNVLPVWQMLFEYICIIIGAIRLVTTGLVSFVA